MPFTLVYPMLERLTIYFNLTEPNKRLGDEKRYLLFFYIVPINEKYYSESVDIVSIIGYITV